MAPNASDRAIDFSTDGCSAANESIRLPMVRSVALCIGLTLLAPGCARGAEVPAVNPCPRPSDQYGPRYEIMAGTYLSRGVSPGGGKFVTIRPTDRGAAPVSVNVTDRVFDIAGTLAAGTHITLFGYVGASVSGAQPPYSCIEWSH
jgi:hypothetical protein